MTIKNSAKITTLLKEVIKELSLLSDDEFETALNNTSGEYSKLLNDAGFILNKITITHNDLQKLEDELYENDPFLKPLKDLRGIDL